MEYLMKVEGNGVVVRGNSTKKGREGWIEITSFSFGDGLRPIHMGQGAKPTVPGKQAYVTKNVDSATTGLMWIASAGKIVRVTVEAVQPGTTLTHVMKDCLLWHGYGGRSDEGIEINFASMSTGLATVRSA